MTVFPAARGVVYDPRPPHMARPLVMLLAFAFAVVSPRGTHAAETSENGALGWNKSAEASFVASQGNADATSLGLKTAARRQWLEAELKLDFGFVFAESRSGDEYGVGALDDFERVEPARNRDAERIYGKVIVDRRITSGVFWFASVDGERDQPADIERRVTASGGLGNTWFAGDAIVFKTSYGATVTDERLAERATKRFGGYRAGYELDVRLSPGARYESDLTYNGNIENGTDYRVESINAIVVAISARVALKASVRAAYRNEPATKEINVFATDPADPSTSGPVLVGKARVPNDTLDTTFATSLVVAF